MKKSISLVGSCIFSLVLLSQTPQQTQQLLHSPEATMSALDISIQQTISNGYQIDDHLKKEIARYKAGYGNYTNSSGKITDFMPNFLPQNSSASQTIPSYTGCGSYPTNGWSVIGPGYSTESYGNIGRLVSVALDIQTNPATVYCGTEAAGLWKKPYGTDDWVNLTDNFGYPGLGIQDIAINPTNSLDIYCATGIGAFSGFQGYGIGIIHSSDGGVSWERLNLDNQPEYNKEALSVKFAPFPPYHLYASVGNNLYVKEQNNNSFNSGSILETTSVGREFIRDIEFIHPDPTVSNDYGKIFLSTHILLRVSGVPTNPKIIFCNLGSNYLPTCTGNINSWNQVSLTNPNSGGIERIALDIEFDNTNPNLLQQNIFASYSAGYNVSCTDPNNPNNTIQKGTVDNFVIKSIDKGLSFTSAHSDIDAPDICNGSFSVAEVGLGAYKNDIEISVSDPTKYFVGGLSLLKCTDDGDPNTNWIDMYGVHDDIRDLKVVIRNNQEELWIAHDGGLHCYNVATGLFTEESGNLHIGEYYGIDVNDNSNKILTGSLDNGSWVYENLEWKKIGPGDGSPCLFLKSNEVSLIASNGESGVFDVEHDGYSNGKVISTDSGDGFYLNTRIEQHPIHDDKALIGMSLVYEYDFSEHYLNFTHLTTQGPEFFSIVDPNQNQFGLSYVTGIAMSNQNSQKIYVTKDHGTHGLFKTETKGAPSGAGWDNLSNQVIIDNEPVLQHYVHFTDVVIDPDDDEHIFLSISGVRTPAWYKVIESNDGGDTWDNVSTGIPNVVVHELEVYNNDGKKILFAGTDLGVYYKNLTIQNSTWQCLNNTLPSVVVKDIDVKYCTNEIYIATKGHGIFKASLSDFFPSITIALNGTTVSWTTDKTFYNDLIIEEDGTLNINGATINMAGNTKIIVKKGATLNLNGSTITSICDAFWGGIEVMSDPTATTQYCSTGQSCDVATVTLINSTIEKADIGIKTTYNANLGGSPAGGVIIAKNSSFVNNRKSIEFGPSENHIPSTSKVIGNRSYLKECTFEINSNYPFDAGNPRNAMVSIVFNRGISFRGCEFKNTSGQVINTTGISAMAANFTVKEQCVGTSCSSAIPTYFSGLRTGVHVSSFGSNHTFLVDKANFIDNKYGIITSRVDGATITRNTFTPYTTIPNNYGLLYLNPIAIHLESSDQYIVEENHITGITETFAQPGQPSLSYYSRGIVAKNSGNNSNSIYKNTFVDLDGANIAYGRNYDPTIGKTYVGLEYECNNMSGSVSRDISIYGADYFGIGGIADVQGGPTHAMDNVFTTGIQSLAGHIYNNSASQSSPILYYHHADINGLLLNPTSISSSVSKQQVSGGDFNPLQHCLTNFGGFTQDLPGSLNMVDKTTRWNKTEDGISGYNQAKYLYVALVDGGDTYGLLNTVQNTNSQTAWDTRTDLINSSPLSIEVIHQTIDEAVLSNALLHDVLMANPDGVRDEEVMYKLENKTNPMPAYMINSLLSIYDQQTQKNVLEAQMATELQNANESARFLLLSWDVDSINPLNDSLLALMQIINTPNSDWRMVAHHVAKGNSNGAQTIMNGIPTKFTLTNEELDTYNDIYSYYTTYISILSAGTDNVKTPTPSQLTSLQQLAIDSTSKAGRMAQNLILYTEGKSFWPNLPAEPQSKNEELNPRAKRTGAVENVKIATVYPNPTNQYVTIQFMDIDPDQEIQIRVINNVGTEVLAHRETMQNGGLINLVTKNLASGQYFVLIYQGDQLLQKQAIEVIH